MKKLQPTLWRSNWHIKLIVILALMMFASRFLSHTVRGQQSGVYTEAQAQRGASLYAKRCAACHGAQLTGGSSLPLVGARFMAKWGQGNHNVEELYFITRTQMPYGAAGTLTNSQYLEIVAYLLKANGYHAGATPLSSDAAALKKILIQPQGATTADLIETPADDSTKSATATGGTLRPTTAAPSQTELNAAQTNSSDWLLTNHDYAGQRFVGLKQITRQNVAALRPVAMYQAGDTNTFHTNPLVYRGVMYLTTADATIALDAATAQLKWRYDWRVKGKPGWPVQRGVAIKDGYVVRGTHDGYLIALDAATGKLLWDRAIVDMTKNEGGFTMPPLIYEDLIFIGPAGSELGVKGWIGAFRLQDGKEVWRFNTIPDDGEPGAETWGKTDARLKGGGSLWSPISLDTEQGLVYFAVANPAPDFYGEARPGANLYSNSLLALEARSGKLKWYYQVVPHDTHDWDLTQASPLFRTTVNGKTRKLVASVGKSGVLHVVDRDTHEKVYAVPVSSQLNTDVPLTTQGVRVCPGIQGGVLWNGPAFNPRTNMLYVNSVEWCGHFGVAKELRYVEGQFYMGGFARLDPVEEARGWVTAMDAATGQIQWRYKSNRQMVAAVTTTATDLVFTGELTGDFIVLDGRDGKVLYRFNTGGPINGGVITYAVDGKQYVAVMSGNATAFWQARPGSSTVIIFALP
ncbi:MAG: PQQ-binding-like beta-propeller repeat protein [Acidobacteria bacterium]|nr:PQQ-binding-like beta-propeller repeat protein [Acidobacteriota bacterium]